MRLRLRLLTLSISAAWRSSAFSASVRRAARPKASRHLLHRPSACASAGRLIMFNASRARLLAASRAVHLSCHVAQPFASPRLAIRRSVARRSCSARASFSFASLISCAPST